MSGPRSNRRQNRGRRTRRMRKFDTSVPSPCQSVCRFDGEPFCRGCYRNAEEIREWPIFSRKQKLEIIEKISQRRKAEGAEQIW